MKAKKVETIGLGCRIAQLLSTLLGFVALWSAVPVSLKIAGSYSPTLPDTSLCSSVAQLTAIISGCTVPGRSLSHRTRLSKYEPRNGLLKAPMSGQHCHNSHLPLLSSRSSPANSTAPGLSSLSTGRVYSLSVFSVVSRETVSSFPKSEKTEFNATNSRRVGMRCWSLQL